VSGASSGASSVKAGRDGLSAYQVAVKDGFVGSEQEWLDSLRAQGGGSNGQNGLSAYQVAVQNGFSGTEQEWLDSLRAQGGGSNGQNGLSAYQVAVQNGFSGTEQEWLGALKGDKGDKGADGAAGVAPSAQDIAAAVKLDADFVQSIKGADGASGVAPSTEQIIAGLLSNNDFVEAAKGEKGDKGDPTEATFSEGAAPFVGGSPVMGYSGFGDANYMMCGPVKWADVVIGGTHYSIPLYTPSS
jgi:hypothetical protein